MSVVTLVDRNIDAGTALESNMEKTIIDLCIMSVSVSAHLICGKVEDAVLQSGCRMWCMQLATAETTAVASSAPEIAVRNTSDLAGEKVYCMRRGDCR